MTDMMLLDSFLRLAGEEAQSAVVRSAEAGEDVGSLCRAMGESGFLDALVPEEKGGAGLSVADMVPLYLAAGEHLLPYPFAETQVARALLAEAGMALDAGDCRPILLWPTNTGGQIRSAVAPMAIGGSLALVQNGNAFILAPLTVGTRGDDPFRMCAASLDTTAPPLARFDATGTDLFDWAAAITAITMAGAMNAMLTMTLAFVNERQQFGRSLSKFQAIQQQLSVAAERTVAAQMAARIGLSIMPGRQGGGVPVLDSQRVAVARAIGNDAAGFCAAVAHAVHGAIGISEEHNLNLYSRRLKRWQVSFGAGSYWAQIIGQGRMAGSSGSSLDHVRTHLSYIETGE